MIMLIDCNNYYVSAERLFNPSARNKPVVVVSNNDGAVVSRSNEAKSLGIKMGTPLFEIKDIITKHNVEVFSSNYALYGDLSQRVMSIIAGIVPEIEIYSIDEAFCNLSGYRIDILEELGTRIRRTINQWVGIPVSVGIAPTKVLAKVASKLAKKNGAGVCLLIDEDVITSALENFAVEDLWGIGYRYTQKLHGIGIHSAQDFRNLPATFVKKQFSVTGLRIVNELNSISCIPVEQFSKDRKAIGSAKGFGTPVSSLSELQEALTTYTSTCALKMRKQKSAASILSVFIQTNYFNKQDKQYSAYRTLTLPVASDLTPVLIKYGAHLLKSIYREGFNYKRVGILLTGLVPASTIQSDLFEVKDLTKLSNVQRTIDSLNSRYSRDQVRFACQGFTKRWKMKQERLSSRFTTAIDEILTVNIT